MATKKILINIDEATIERLAEMVAERQGRDRVQVTDRVHVTELISLLKDGVGQTDQPEEKRDEAVDSKIGRQIRELAESWLWVPGLDQVTYMEWARSRVVDSLGTGPVTDVLISGSEVWVQNRVFNLLVFLTSLPLEQIYDDPDWAVAVVDKGNGRKSNMRGLRIRRAYDKRGIGGTWTYHRLDPAVARHVLLDPPTHISEHLPNPSV